MRGETSSGSATAPSCASPAGTEAGWSGGSSPPSLPGPLPPDEPEERSSPQRQGPDPCCPSIGNQLPWSSQGVGSRSPSPCHGRVGGPPWPPPTVRPNPSEGSGGGSRARECDGGRTTEAASPWGPTPRASTSPCFFRS